MSDVLFLAVVMLGAAAMEWGLWRKQRRDHVEREIDSLPAPEWVRPIEAPPGDASCCGLPTPGAHRLSCEKAPRRLFRGDA